jgi:hypothetical protein
MGETPVTAPRVAVDDGFVAGKSWEASGFDAILCNYFPLGKQCCLPVRRVAAARPLARLLGTPLSPERPTTRKNGDAIFQMYALT